ncbi:MAG TPA: AtpZ/AtpI family protein [Rhodothermales bacterium]|nr:AtpZ/AtpI family protein [Rhodothermales bacterium]
MSIDGSEQEQSGRQLSSRANLLGLGWQIASTLLLFTAGGYALDRWLDTLPWFLLAGAVLGMVGIFYQILRIANELNADEKRKKSEVRGPRSNHPSGSV